MLLRHKAAECHHHVRINTVRELRHPRRLLEEEGTGGGTELGGRSEHPARSLLTNEHQNSGSVREFAPLGGSLASPFLPLLLLRSWSPLRGAALRFLLRNDAPLLSASAAAVLSRGTALLLLFLPSSPAAAVSKD